MHSFDISVEQYQRQIGTHWYDLELIASDNLTLARVECRFPIAGLWKGGLVALHEGKPRAVGKSQVHHDLLPISARLIECEPLRVQSVEIEMRGRTLHWLLGRIDPRRTYFLNGEIQTGRVEPVANVEPYRPMAYAGQAMTLHYARAAELGPWPDRVAAKGEAFVRFWLRSGEATVTLGVGEEREVERIPEQLQQYLRAARRGAHERGGSLATADD